MPVGSNPRIKALRDWHNAINPQAKSPFLIVVPSRKPIAANSPTDFPEDPKNFSLVSISG
jgi:hypothetical protein